MLKVMGFRFRVGVQGWLPMVQGWLMVSEGLVYGWQLMMGKG